jgi:hypothetical protein
MQLHRVGLAIQSPVVPEPDERGRALAPKVAEADVMGVLVGEHDVSEPVGA